MSDENLLYIIIDSNIGCEVADMCYCYDSHILIFNTHTVSHGTLTMYDDHSENSSTNCCSSVFTFSETQSRGDWARDRVKASNLFTSSSTPDVLN